MIKLKDVCKTYNDQGRCVSALVGVNLEIHRSRFVTIMGPSGCGKTTLLHLIAGLDRASSGRIEIDGISLDGLNETELTLLRQKKIGVVFQFFNLLPTLNVMENVLLPLVLQKGETPPDKDKAASLLGSVGLAGRMALPVSKLSGGEQQRVAIVRALMVDPLILLADEPTGNLDSESGEQVMDLLKSIAQTNGLTVVLVTHSLDIARRGDRMLKMRDGKVVEDVVLGASPFSAKDASWPGD